MYSTTNYKTKKALKEAVMAGKKVSIYQPGGMFNPPEAHTDYSGKAYLEGPHYPAPHTWYAEVTMQDGYVVKVK